ncbi:PREDICTED: replication factor C subunit 3-like, partial [Amphimedon queenslandica]|uniref:Replication factor C subunit 3 n=1 Tax=Amphimedon queenslandica TaxID=400682 RepID=A0AAN0JQM5_AMPQE
YCYDIFLFIYCSVVVLTEVDRLTKDAQHALRRTMELYTGTCHLILVCNSTSKLIPAIKSRCLAVRVPAPTIDEICSVLQYVCHKESLTIPDTLAKKIAEKSERSLRKAILLCEVCRVQQYPFNDDQVVPDCEWEVFLRETAAMIITEQSPKRLLEVRGRYYELLTHCISPDINFKRILNELVANCDGTLKAEVTQLAAQYQAQSQLGSKAIFHLEAFTAKFMRIYKQFLEKGLESMGF